KKRLEVKNGERAYWGLSFSADGKRLAAASYEAVYVWDAATLQVLHTVPLKRERSYYFSVSPDTKTLALPSVDGKKVELVNIAMGRVTRELTWPGKAARQVLFSPDGRWLAGGGGSEDPTLVVWDLPDGKLRQLVREPGAQNWALAFSPDGRRLAGAGGGRKSDATVVLWEVESGRPFARLKGHTAGAWALAFSPDGTRLASAGGDRTA